MLEGEPHEEQQDALGASAGSEDGVLRAARRTSRVQQPINIEVRIVAEGGDRAGGEPQKMGDTGGAPVAGANNTIGELATGGAGGAVPTSAATASAYPSQTKVIYATVITGVKYRGRSGMTIAMPFI